MRVGVSSRDVLTTITTKFRRDHCLIHTRTIFLFGGGFESLSLNLKYPLCDTQAKETEWNGTGPFSSFSEDYENTEFYD